MTIAPVKASTENGKSKKLMPSQRVEQDLRRRIRDGHWPSGAMLPSRHDLAREYSVALHTVQRAIGALLSDGTLTSTAGRGTFVASFQAQHENTLPDIAETVRAGGTMRAGGDIRPAWSRLQNNFTLPQAARMTASVGIIATLQNQPDGGQMDVMTSWWSSEIVSALEIEFSALGGSTRFFNRFRPGEKWYPLDKAVMELTKQQCQALVVLDIYDTNDPMAALLAMMETLPVPVIYISWEEMRRPISHVFYDQFYAGYQAALHLLQTGRRKIVFIAPFSQEWVEQRIQGAESAISDARMPPESFVVHRTFDGAGLSSDSCEERDLKGGRAFVEYLKSSGWRRENRDLGVIAPNDFTASGVMKAAQSLELAAGVEYGIIGFDDAPISRNLGLSTMRPPLHEMGTEAARLAGDAISGNKMRQQIRLHSRLIARQTTRAAV
jgi:DNA-binding LacI/PurR family transcriptional regulator/DNA-binding transcriptional regulator YhcF (GntR family)